MKPIDPKDFPYISSLSKESIKVYEQFARDLRAGKCDDFDAAGLLIKQLIEMSRDGIKLWNQVKP